MTPTTLDVQLENREAIDVLLRFPEQDRSTVAAKYIVLGDTVAHYAQIVTSQETVERYFDPVGTRLGNLVADVETALSRLENRIPESVKISTQDTVTQLSRAQAALDDLCVQYRELLGEQVTNTVKAALADASRDITSAAESLQDNREMLRGLIPSLAKTAKKGALSCEAIYLTLQKTFRDDRFQDVTFEARYTDIVGMMDSCDQPIYIEVKDHSNPVPSSEVEKFWRDMDAQRAYVGVFLSMRTPIRTVTSDFAIETKGSRIGIFAVCEQIGDQGHILGYAVARKILQMIQGRGVTVQGEKIEWMSSVLNDRLRELKTRLQDLEKVQDDIQHARWMFDRDMQSIARQITDLRGSLHTIIDITLNDFEVVSRTSNMGSLDHEAA